jgi:phosphoesterase RecJ-like protein
MQYAEQIFQEIQKARTILLHCHPKPDPDSVGSALAMYHALVDMGKAVDIIAGDSDIIEGLTLPGIEHIQKKNFFEVDLAKYDLFIILDSASKEMVSRKGDVVFPDTLRTIAIDHHESNTEFADINAIHPEAAATAHILANYFQEWGITITQPIAACLLAGIYADSGGFVYQRTTKEVLEIACRLAEKDPDFRKRFLEVTQGGTTKEMLAIRGIAFSHMQEIAPMVVLAAVSYQQLQEDGINTSRIGMNGVATELCKVKEWNIGITALEKEPGFVSVSLRAKEGTGNNVAHIAMALGGGGHALASGAALSCSFLEAKELIITAVKNNI